MSGGRKFKSVVSKLEIVLCCVLFVIMLVTCGLYINIKMNGKTSSLPSLSEKDRYMLLKSVASEQIAYGDDLLEPVFVGIKDGDEMIAALPEKNVRNTIRNNVYDALQLLFSGRSEEVKFDSIAERNEYIYSLKNSNRYMLISFLGNVPSTVFLPCVSDGFESLDDEIDLFYIKHIFILPVIGANADGEEILCAVTVSKDNEINIVRPQNEIPFNNIISDSYDISDGYSKFEFLKDDGIYPVLTTSFVSKKYKISCLSELHGKDLSAVWLQTYFDTFGINTSLVRSFSSGDGKVTTYVDDQRELVVSDEGTVIFNATDDGIYLNEFLGYFPEEGIGYRFSDKIFAVKNIVDRLKINSSLVSFTIVGVDFNADASELNIYMKLIVDGVTVTNKQYDSVFRIRHNYLNYVEFPAVTCNFADGEKLLVPQKYSPVVFDGSTDENGASRTYCPVLFEDEAGDEIMSVEWAVVSIKGNEEENNGNS